MKPLVIVFFIAVAVLSFFGFMFHVLNEGDRQREQSYREWLQFSMQHHCHISKQSSFSEPRVTWQCDGFEVQR